MRAFLLALLFPALAAASPEPAVVTYKMYWGGIPIADVTDTLEFAAGGYAISSESVATGLAAAIGYPPVNRYSTGTYTDAGELVPDRYEQTHDGASRISVIDRGSGKVLIDKEGEKSEGEITQDEVHDILTVMYSFYSEGEAGAGGTLNMTDGRRLIEVELVRVSDEPESVSTGVGEVMAHKYERVTDRDDREYFFWYSEGLRNMPVRVTLKRKNSFIEFVLQGADFGGG